ncbi:MAG: hypothetical protein H0W85_10385 [Methylotenera sp.]|nr:hypothetical protein [Methylotenera sp.]
MNAIQHIKQEGFSIELLPNNNIGVRPNALNQMQRDYFAANKIDIVRHLQIEMVRAWLHKIGEPPEDYYLVIEKCMSNPDALLYFLRHARGEYEPKTERSD